MVILQLNHMRDVRIEILSLVGWTETMEEMEAFLESEKVKPYQDEFNGRLFTKSYRKDGPLEWYNPPMPGYNNLADFKSFDEYMETYKKNWEDLRSMNPQLTVNKESGNE